MCLNFHIACLVVQLLFVFPFSELLNYQMLTPSRGSQITRKLNKALLLHYPALWNSSLTDRKYLLTSSVCLRKSKRAR